ncbi:hypothetical protein [Variovorax sp. WS11]|uniref:hypothetical protein n=1 Tax=Variovorax sp. WS11 TaxID=1105204 RepID=UPI0011B28ECB|nr:hypothetical protein [Variovorax sp. WS11]NDZ17787.1 hypothetical protein [Variovorax sp. WS11]
MRDPSLHSQVEAFIAIAKRNAKAPLDWDELERLAAIKVTVVRRGTPTKKRGVRFTDRRGQRYWWLSTQDLSRTIEEREGREAGQALTLARKKVKGGNADLSQIRWPQSGRPAKEARVGDLVINCHADRFGDGNTAFVYAPAVIVSIRKGKGWVRFQLQCLLDTWRELPYKIARSIVQSIDGKAIGPKSARELSAGEKEAIMKRFSTMAQEKCSSR